MRGSEKHVTYLTLVPVTHLILENLLLLGLKSLADAKPAATNGAANIADATLLSELAGNVLVGPALLLEVDNARIIGIVVGLDGLRAGGLATSDLDVAVVGKLVLLGASLVMF